MSCNGGKMMQGIFGQGLEGHYAALMSPLSAPVKGTWALPSTGEARVVFKSEC